MILLIISTLIGLYLFDHFYWKRRNLPPGPLPLPFLGNVLSFVGSEPTQVLINWRKKYGDVYTFWLGTLPLVSVTQLDKINDMFVKDGESYAGRPFDNLEGLEMNRNGRTGIIFTDGEVWRDLRRFSLHTLRDFGVGRNLMQEKILDEVVITLNAMKADLVKNEKSDQVQNHIDIAVGSIIMQLIFGYKYSSNSDTREEFFKYKKLIDEMMSISSSLAGLMLQKHTHRYKNWPYVGSRYRRLVEIKTTLFQMFERKIDEKRQSLDLGAHAESADYVEAFLRRQHELDQKADSSNEAFTEEHLQGALWDMWIAGQETTSNTLGWACIFLINNPGVQEKIHQELDRVIGSDRLVTNEDKPSLHYLNAVITEVQRLCNLVPLNIPHRLTRDVEINGFKLLEGTTIANQMSVVMYDEEIFPEPHKFKPERHLDQNNNNYKPHPAVIPFGVGKRSCLGEALARMELFLFVANICNNFVLSSEKPLSEFRKMGGTVHPPVFECVVKNRH